jgi:hypothetical protein
LAASPGSLVGVVIALETRNAGTNILPKIAAESHEIRQTQKPDQGKIKMGINELGVLHGRLYTLVGLSAAWQLLPLSSAISSGEVAAEQGR